jgi:FkbM family methyltransferase
MNFSNSWTACKQQLKRSAEKGGFYISRYPMASLEESALDIQNKLLKTGGAVLHIGAHRGQEAKYYSEIGIKVIWIEANPAMFEMLSSNIAKYKNQRAICALLGDSDGSLIDFHIASNDGMSSSMFQFGEELGFSGLNMTNSEKLTMKRLDKIFSVKDLNNFTHWVLDVQGAELLVLEGAGVLLDTCHSLYIEVSTRNVYKDGASWKELSGFLKDRGFVPLWDPKAKSHENIIFIRYRSNS